MKTSHIVASDPNLVTRRQVLRNHYIDQRGADLVGGVLVPRTTGADVKQLAAMWSREVAKVSPRGAEDRRQIRAWAACMNQVAAHATELGQVYRFNEAFWQRCTSKLAIWLNARQVVPSKWSLVLDATVESITGLPGTLGGVGRATGGAVSGAFGKVGDVLEEAGTTAKWALLLGGAAVTVAVVGPTLIRAVRKS